MKNFLALLCFTGLSLACLSQNVVQLEYYVDTDAGYGNNTVVNVTPAADGSFPFIINVASFIPGFHKLYIRTKDSDGKWSLTARRNIEVFASEAKTTIVSGEYFIDTDPGFGSGIPIIVAAPDSAILQNFAAVAAGLSEGYHKLYGRFKDNEGRWSLSFRRNMEVFKDVTNYVTKVEYFFTTDQSFGNNASVTFANPSVDGSFSFDIPINTIPAEADTLFIRVQDSSQNNWSITQVKGISVIVPLTLLNFGATKQNTTAQLNWQTANEVNTAYFNVQRSTDGINFTTVGKLTAKNNASVEHHYLYEDDIAKLKAGEVYYRLQMMDIDGRFTYSWIANITIDVNSKNITIHPNPAHHYFIIGNYNNIDVSNASILVRDLKGRLLISQKFNNTTEQRINISSLSKGIYMISIVTPGHVQTQKLVVE